MNKHYSHLVWLGAGATTEPKNLLTNAEKITLVDAQESVCKFLQQNNNAHVSINQLLLTSDGLKTEFTTYNLPEFSAIQPISGLKTLFPGIKAIKTEQLSSIKISVFIEGLELQTGNNLLVMDIPDTSLQLLQELQNAGQLDQFCEIRLQIGINPLYSLATTRAEITKFLEDQGYVLNEETSNDPDMPWLSFNLNVLWQPLQDAQEHNKTISKELEEIKHQLNEKIDEIQKLHQQLSIIQLKQQEIARLTQELAQIEKQATTRLDKISQLEKQNRSLHETNIQLEKQQTSLKQEMFKAEAQIEIIKELLLN